MPLASEHPAADRDRDETGSPPWDDQTGEPAGQMRFIANVAVWL
jgi:hypothetical protein